MTMPVFSHSGANQIPKILPQPGGPAVVTLATNKGGVGKSTTATHLAAAFALAGHRTLIVDFDNQGQSATLLGVSQGINADNDVHALLIDRSSADLQPLQARRNLWIVATSASSDQAGSIIEAERILNSRRAQPHDLMDRFASQVAGFDAVVIDCPPEGFFFDFGVALADVLVHPFIPTYASAVQVGPTLARCSEIQRFMFADEGAASSLLLPLMKDRTRDARLTMDDLLASGIVGERQMLPAIRSTVKVKEAQGYWQTVFEHSRRHPVCDDYFAVAAQIVEVINHA